MGTSGTWRQQLLGSLQGQLQLATYLVVFLGFTSASSAGLWIGQHNLIQNEMRILRSSAQAMQECLTAGGNNDQFIQQELLVHSSGRTKLWMEKRNGALVLPESDHLPISRAAVQATMVANPDRVVGLQRVLDLEDRRLLTELVQRFPDGSHLWIQHEVSSNQQALSNYLALMTLIWGSCLVLTLLMVSWLVRRIVQPLDQLTAATAQVTAQTLTSAKLQLKQAPMEVLQLSRTYNALLERLAESWSQQRQFVSAVSHELRTPLTIVQGYVQRTIKRGDNLSDSQIQGLNTAADESIRMRQLLDDLLDLSRGDSGHLSLSSEPVALAEHLQEVVSLARSTLQRPLELILPELPDERSVIVQADPTRLRQVLLDLIENADKYSPSGRPVRMVLNSSSDHGCIAVIDQGIGIPDAEQDTVFQRFQRGSNATEQTGSGLGLSVVKLLVEGMGGTIELRSRLGEGSCFTVKLPR